MYPGCNDMYPGGSPLPIQVGGSYDAKAGGEDGFAPGGASLHVASTPHGPDTESYNKALAADRQTQPRALTQAQQSEEKT